MTGTRVYLVRHAKAEKDHPRGDAARRLTGDGRESFALLVRELGSALTLRRILSSPFVRALETARVLSQVTGAEVEVAVGDVHEDHPVGRQVTQVQLEALARQQVHGDGVAASGCTRKCL